MISIYYILGIIIVFSLIRVLFNFKKYYFVREWSIKYKKITNKELTKKSYRNETDYNISISSKSIAIIENLWLIIGLFTKFNFFITIIIYNFIKIPILLFIELSSISRALFFLDLIFRISIYIFVIYKYYVN